MQLGRLIPARHPLRDCVLTYVGLEGLPGLADQPQLLSVGVPGGGLKPRDW